MNGEKKDSKGILSGLFWVYCETIAAQAVTFIVTIVLARLLNPDDYGNIALVTVFISIADVFVKSSFSNALIQKRDADALDYSTMFWFTLVLSFFLYAVLFAFAPSIGGFYHNNQLCVVLRVLALRIPASAFNSIQLAYVSNHMNFKKSFISTSGGAFFSAMIGIVLALCGFGIWALVAQSIGNVLLNTIFLLFVVDWRPRIEFSWDRLKEMVSFGWKLTVTGLMFTGYNELRTLIIGKRYSTEDLGYYDKGVAFPRFIASNIDSTITRVMLPAMSQIQDDRSRLAQMTRRSAKTSAYIMTPILFGLAMIAEPLVSLLLTAKWLPCVPYLQIMCISWWMQPTQSCSAQAIKAIGRSDKYLLIEIISKAAGLILLVLSLVLYDTPLMVAVSMLINQVVAMAIYGTFASKYIGYSLKSQIKDLTVPALLGGIMCVVVWMIRNRIANPILCMVFQIIAGGVTYLGLSALLKVESFEFLFSMFKKARG